jgi:hypothetical protein
MSLIDFAENYIFMDFNEIQEIYWHSFQLIILAHVSYRWNLANISDVNSGVKKFDYRVPLNYIFDNNEHDTLFVQHCSKLLSKTQ